jgi:hypothetical protein
VGTTLVAVMWDVDSLAEEGTASAVNQRTPERLFPPALGIQKASASDSQKAASTRNYPDIATPFGAQCVHVGLVPPGVG